MWGHRAIPVDAPENGQLCFYLGCMELQAAAAFTKWAPAPFQRITLAFSRITVVSDLC